MRKIFSTIAFSILALNSLAFTIENPSGRISTIVPDRSITDLKINGTMNAVDFKFIADSLNNLQTLNLSNATIEEYRSTKTIFANVTSYAANTIPGSAFAFNSTLSHVTLPSTLKTIGGYAFAGCTNIQSIEIPQSVDSIAEYAFTYSGITTATIPANVTIVGDGAFSKCQSLATITVNDQERTKPLTIGNQAFLGNQALKTVNLGKNVINIGERAFSGCNNESFTVNVSPQCELREIGNRAFANSSIKTFAFENCPKLKAISEFAFASSALQEINIPENIELIGKGAFYYNTNLAAANLGNCSASISPLLFAGCNSSSQLIGIDNSTNEIGSYAYYGWDKVKKIVIPESVAFIGNYAFGNMSGLEKITSIRLEAPETESPIFSGITPANIWLTTKIAASGYDALQWAEFKRTLNGDADCNNAISINDIVSIIGYTNGKAANEFMFEAADANVDNNVTTDDITLIEEIILNAE